MEEKEAFEIYRKLMMKALEEPNGINNVCMQVIISLAVIGEKNEVEFKEILDYMEECFKQMDTLEDYVNKTKVIMGIMSL